MEEQPRFFLEKVHTSKNNQVYTCKLSIEKETSQVQQVEHRREYAR
jgi:hypothetical protein